MTSAESTPLLSQERGREILENAPGYMTPEIGSKMGISKDALREFAGCMSLPNPPRILHPGSSTDTGVAEVFGRENVVNLDSHSEAMAVMSQHGYLAIDCPIDSYEAPPFDLMVVRSAPILEEGLINRLIKPGGYLITNTWHMHAADLVKNDELRLIGAFAEDALLNKEVARSLLSTYAQGATDYTNELFLYQTSRVEADGA